MFYTLRLDHEDDEAGGPISLLLGRGGVAVPGGGDGSHEPSTARVMETVAKAGGVGKKTRAREILRLMDGRGLTVYNRMKSCKHLKVHHVNTFITAV